MTGELSCNLVNAIGPNRNLYGKAPKLQIIIPFCIYLFFFVLVL